MRKRTSIIWTCPRATFCKVVTESESYAEILRFFGKENKGNNFRTLKSRIKEEQINTDHIDSTRSQRLFGNHRKAIPLKDIMVEDSTYSRSYLKKRLLRDGLIDNVCHICKQEPKWHNQPLVMVLDHINGNSRDHRRHNLRLLCPNCNSQQVTFAGKQNKIVRQCSCGNTIIKGSKSCKKCANRAMGFKRRRTVRPSKDVLAEDVAQYGYSATGRKYGVSDNAIRKWLKSNPVV